MHVYRLLIFVNALNLDLKERFSQFFEGHRNVVSFVHCIGSWDYELRVEVQDPQEIVQLKQQLYELFGNDISTVKVLPMFSDIKISNYPFYDITAELPRAGRPHGDTVLATSNRVANQSGPTNQNRAGVVKVANG